MAALAMSVSPVFAQTNPQPAAPPMMAPAQASVAEVIKLSKAGVGDDVVLAYVKNVRTPFRLKADDVRLRNADAEVDRVVLQRTPVRG